MLRLLGMMVVINHGYRCDPLLFRGVNYAKIGGWEYKLK